MRHQGGYGSIVRGIVPAALSLALAACGVDLARPDLESAGLVAGSLSASGDPTRNVSSSVVAMPTARPGAVPTPDPANPLNLRTYNLCEQHLFEGNGRTSVLTAPELLVKLYDERSYTPATSSQPAAAANYEFSGPAISTRIRNLIVEKQMNFALDVPEGRYYMIVCDKNFADRCEMVERPKDEKPEKQGAWGRFWGTVGYGYFGDNASARTRGLATRSGQQPAGLVAYSQEPLTLSRQVSGGNNVATAGPTGGNEKMIISLYGPNNNAFWDANKRLAEACDTQTSPLVVRMDSSSEFKLGEKGSGMDFDIEGNGTKARISKFTATTDAFLSYDVNGDGLISSVHELFGNRSAGPDGLGAANGFAALAKHDVNADGRIDAADPIFSSLRLWFERDGDALGSGDELVGLAEAGIESIELSFEEGFHVDASGNQVRQYGSARSDKGTTLEVLDVWFSIL